MYAILAFAVVLVVCMTVSWACQLVYGGGSLAVPTCPTRRHGSDERLSRHSREDLFVYCTGHPGASDGGLQAAGQISTVLEHLQTVQDETNVEWERHLRDDLRATRRATAELRRLQPDAERKVASWWWWILCETPPPALVPGRWCAGLPSRVVAVLDKAIDVTQGARKIREVHIKDGRILVSAHDVKEEVCRLHDQDVLGGMVKEVARQISAQVKDSGSDVPDGVVREEDKLNEGIAAAGTMTATTESLRRAETRLSDQRSGLRVNCMAAAHVEAGVGIVRDRLVAQVDALEEISDSFVWLRQSVVDQEKSVPDAIEKGIELLATLEAELMRCV
ncbi:hypothetical protein CCHR01_17566 [Colletotrichum chrysophilum]|uniref:Methyl-accepting transducer domain-containing protein n=2 Tax=Colletotrichum chrysophilum TaxID=1836956 RepID=A0AAD9A280_9PEZI|nr:hypothetical protein CCHR01_17566 [Colletotrichum chrysophilum]